MPGNRSRRIEILSLFWKRSTGPLNPELDDAWAIERASIGFPMMVRERLHDVIDTEIFEAKRKLDAVEVTHASDDALTTSGSLLSARDSQDNASFSRNSTSSSLHREGEGFLQRVPTLTTPTPSQDSIVRFLSHSTIDGNNQQHPLASQAESTPNATRDDGEIQPRTPRQLRDPLLRNISTPLSKNVQDETEGIQSRTRSVPHPTPSREASSSRALHDEDEIRERKPSQQQQRTSTLFAALQSAERFAKAIRKNRPKYAKVYEPHQSSKLRRSSSSMGKRAKKKGKGSKSSEPDPSEVEGLFGTKMKVSKWNISYHLTKNATQQTKKIVAWVAWFVCLIGLIVALIFITRDFLASQRELASTVRYEPTKEMSFPAFWICLSDSSLPLYHDFPLKGYVGKPLMWVDFFQGSKSLLNVSYPLTNSMSQVSFTSMNIHGERCNVSGEMDPIEFLKDQRERPSCFSCLQYARKPPFSIDRDNLERNQHSASAHIALRISMTSIIGRCRTSHFGLSYGTLRFFRQQLTVYHEELTRRGIIDFGGLDPTNTSHTHLLWPYYRFGFENTTLDLGMVDLVDMFCNVYMFSGLFYPSKSTNVSYSFDNKRYRWRRIGSGPYFPPSLDNHLFSSTGRLQRRVEAATIGGEKYDNMSTNYAHALYLLSNSSRRGRVSFLSSMWPMSLTRVEMTRNVIHGRESFDVRQVPSIVNVGDSLNVNHVYFVQMGFSSFLTQVVSEQQSMSWTAYFADFFGITSLFLDISVYTVIVAPLVLRVRRRFEAAPMVVETLRARRTRSSSSGSVPVGPVTR